MSQNGKLCTECVTRLILQKLIPKEKQSVILKVWCPHTEVHILTPEPITNWCKHILFTDDDFNRAVEAIIEGLVRNIVKYTAEDVVRDLFPDMVEE